MTGNLSADVRRLKKVLKKKGGRAVVPCNLESTKAAIRCLEGYTVVYGDQDATIAQMTEAEHAAEKARIKAEHAAEKARIKTERAAEKAERR